MVYSGFVFLQRCPLPRSGALGAACVPLTDATQARCAGSVDATWGECGADGDNGAPPCQGKSGNQSKHWETIHEPYGAWLATQNITDPAVVAKYNTTNGFTLDFRRYKELLSRGEYGGVAWYNIPDALPQPDDQYQDNWIGRQSLRLLSRAPKGKPWFLEVSHQAPHPVSRLSSSPLYVCPVCTFGFVVTNLTRQFAFSR